MKETKEVTVFACGYCGKLYYEKEQADFCHADRTCMTCGKVIGKKNYYLDCEECRIKKAQLKQQEVYDKARKMTLEEYYKEFPEYPLVWDDNYYFEVEDMEYSFEKEDMPKWVWGAKQTISKLDPYSIVEHFEENTGLEDFELGKAEVTEIVEFCNQWNNKHGVEVYYEDTGIVVLLD